MSIAPRSLTPAQYIAGSNIPLTAAQVRNAVLIMDLFTRAGYAPHVALAAVANAQAESKLNERAEGDAGKSIGLFQLYDNGAGKGMTKYARMNPTANTARIIAEVARYGSRVLAAKNIQDASQFFGRDVERYSQSLDPEEAENRRNLARRLFPSWKDTPSKDLPKITVGWSALPLLFVAGVSWIAYRRWKKQPLLPTKIRQAVPVSLRRVIS